MKETLNIKQERVMIYFIKAARELIATEGAENLTVRKVAMTAGYNSATLYNYFDDMEELIIFASIGYLSEYISNLGKALNPQMNARQRYRTIYEVFSASCFQHPEIFYNLFYGKYKRKLEKLISVYYRLFPDELGEHQGEILRMLTKGDIEERDKAIMPSLVEKGFVAEENLEQTVILMIRMFQSYLYDAWMKYDERSAEEWCQAVMESFDYIMDKAALTTKKEK